MGRPKPAETADFLAFSDLGMSLYVPLSKGTQRSNSTFCTSNCVVSAGYTLIEPARDDGAETTMASTTKPISIGRTSTTRRAVGDCRLPASRKASGRASPFAATNAPAHARSPPTSTTLRRHPCAAPRRSPTSNCRPRPPTSTPRFSAGRSVGLFGLNRIAFGPAPRAAPPPRHIFHQEKGP